MFVGLDGFNERLQVNITATETSINLGTGLCTRLNGGTSTLQISDGVSTEFIGITACSGSTATITRGLYGTVARSWVANSCVTYKVTTQIVCELINGGCAGAAVVCTPVKLSSQITQDAVVGKEWVGIFAFNDSTSVSAATIPTWVTATVSGGAIVLKGIPSVGTVEFTVGVVGLGCNSSSAIGTTKIRVCEEVSI